MGSLSTEVRTEVLCGYICELEEERDQLRTENAKLYEEKKKLERRVDELCAEIERLHADQAHWELGNCPQCPNVVSLQEVLEQNAKLRTLFSSYWKAVHSPVTSNVPRNYLAEMRELGVEVD